MLWSGSIYPGGSRSGIVGVDRVAWQWQPTRTAHDPNPPITLEDGAAQPAIIAVAFDDYELDADHDYDFVDFSGGQLPADVAGLQIDDYIIRARRRARR